MSRKMFSIPARDPVDGGELFVSELTGAESGVMIRGAFAIPTYARLSEENAAFLDAFLRCRGNLSAVESQAAFSHSPVNERLDALLAELGIAPQAEATPPPAPVNRLTILGQLDRGEITPSEAKTLLGL